MCLSPRSREVSQRIPSVPFSECDLLKCVPLRAGSVECYSRLLHGSSDYEGIAIALLQGIHGRVADPPNTSGASSSVYE